MDSNGAVPQRPPPLMEATSQGYPARVGSGEHTAVPRFVEDRWCLLLLGDSTSLSESQLLVIALIGLPDGVMSTAVSPFKLVNSHAECKPTTTAVAATTKICMDFHTLTEFTFSPV